MNFEVNYASPQTPGPIKRTPGQWVVLLLAWVVGLAVWALYIAGIGVLMMRFLGCSR
jgi:hypothetical protein